MLFRLTYKLYKLKTNLNCIYVTNIDYENGNENITENSLKRLLNLQAWIALLPIYMENTLFAIQKLGGYNFIIECLYVLDSERSERAIGLKTMYVFFRKAVLLQELVKNYF